MATVFIMAVVITMATIIAMAKEEPMRDSRDRAAVLDRVLAEVFRKSGWSVKRHRAPAENCPDLSVKRGDLTYAVEVKYAPEGRRDRMLPLLAEAILRARAAVRRDASSRPLAIVASERVRKELAEELISFAAEYAPDVAVGVVDGEGLRSFVGPGLDQLKAIPKPRGREAPSVRERAPDLFSGLNQWMLKVLLAPRINQRFLGGPRGYYQNPSDLARAAGVSVMSAFRLVRQLESERFIDPGTQPLELVRIEELLRRWRAASMRVIREWPLRFSLRSRSDGELQRVMDLLRSMPSGASRAPRGPSHSTPPRFCLGLFAAADVLGIGHVSGVSPHVYVDDLRRVDLNEFGLLSVPDGQPASLILREARAPRSLFGAAVLREGVHVADAIQIWLDVVDHSSRGTAQAREIERLALAELFEKRR